ncbi:Hypothetical_protein [Hexamita inflata]|uniref:Hypothetical_protein n=1 Tax=Hexamita inflata TaxID=28002 RepID=A0AA86UIP5_9EUKA|nr:Hypothetical protein HINF_LOCUS29163 [Hexamita inflata]
MLQRCPSNYIGARQITSLQCPGNASIHTFGNLEPLPFLNCILQISSLLQTQQYIQRTEIKYRNTLLKNFVCPVFYWQTHFLPDVLYRVTILPKSPIQTLQARDNKTLNCGYRALTVSPKRSQTHKYNTYIHEIQILKKQQIINSQQKTGQTIFFNKFLIIQFRSVIYTAKHHMWKVVVGEVLKGRIDRTMKGIE